MGTKGAVMVLALSWTAPASAQFPPPFPPTISGSAGYLRRTVEKHPGPERKARIAFLDGCRATSDRFVAAVVEGRWSEAHALFSRKAAAATSERDMAASAEAGPKPYGTLRKLQYRNQSLEISGGGAMESKIWYAMVNDGGTVADVFAIVVAVPEAERCAVQSYQLMEYQGKVPEWLVLPDTPDRPLE